MAAGARRDGGKDPLAQVLPQQLVQFCGRNDGDVFAVHPDQLLCAEFRQRARKRSEIENPKLK